MPYIVSCTADIIVENSRMLNADAHGSRIARVVSLVSCDGMLLGFKIRF